MTFLLAYLNVHYLILLSMVHEYAYFLWIHLENGQFSAPHTENSDVRRRVSRSDVVDCHARVDAFIALVNGSKLHPAGVSVDPNPANVTRDPAPVVLGTHAQQRRVDNNNNNTKFI